MKRPKNELAGLDSGGQRCAEGWAPPLLLQQLTGGENGAGNEVRTRDLNLGKVALYQLSYTR